MTAALVEQAWKAAKAAGEREADRAATRADHDADAGQGAPAAGVPGGVDDRRRRQDPNEIARRLATVMLDQAHAEGISAPSGERFAVQVSIDVETLAAVMGVELDSTLPVRLGRRAFLLESAHHVHQHHQGGPTRLSNGILLCSWHHRRLHREGWTVTSDGDQAFTFWDGRRCLGTTTRGDRPPGRAPDLATAVGPVRVPPPERPGTIGPDTPRSVTGGERLTSFALDVYLHHLLAARRGRPRAACRQLRVR